MFDKLKIFFSQFKEQGANFYLGLTKGRKIAIIITIFIILFAIIAFAFWKPEKQYEVAYTNLSNDDKIAILAFLKKSLVADFKLEGDTISFPNEQLLDIKMKLAEEGLPSSGTGIGWEKFDSQNFGATDFDQKINKIRAIQGELARTINKLTPIEASRVQIAMPEQAVFSDEKKSVTASIFLRLKHTKTLTQRQIQGVLHLVSGAVEGLDIKNISIIDQEGNMLTSIEHDDGGFDKITNTQREYQKRIEKEYAQKIRDILNRVVGSNNVVPSVQTEIDFKKVETTLQDVDPDRVVLISSQRGEQSSSGSGTNPTGVPGAKSNIPGEVNDLPNSGGMQNSSKQNNESLNYEVKKTISKIIEPIGTIKKLSVSVLVNHKIVNGKLIARNKEEIATITNLTKNAIGFQEGRDSIAVESAQFELDEFALAEQASLTARKTSLLQTGIFAGVAVIAMIFLFFAVVKPYFKWLTFDPEKQSREQYAVIDYDLERSGSAAKRVQVQEEIPFEKLSPKEQIMYLAKHDPKKTSEALRQFLSPNHT